MGVPPAGKYFLHRYPKAFSSRLPLNPGTINLDFNTIPYGQLGISYGVGDAARMLHILDEKLADALLNDRLTQAIEAKLDHIISIAAPNARDTQPLELVYIAVDGIVVIGKIAQQRTRRFETAEKNTRRQEFANNLSDYLNKKEHEEHLFIGANTPVEVPGQFRLKKEEIFQQVALIYGESHINDSDVKEYQRFIRAPTQGKTTGPTKEDISKRLEFLSQTLFDTNCISPGTDFMRNLDKKLQTAIKRQYTTWNTSSVIYSSHEVPGEGEHKIFEHLRQAAFLPGSSHIIYSNDADLIFLSLASKIPGIHVWRVKENAKGWPARDSVVNVDILRDEIRRGENKVANRNTIELEIAFFFSILGNDFVPPLVEMSDFSDLADEILDRMGALAVLTDEGTIYWHNFFEILRSIVNEASAPLLDVRREKYSFSTLEKHYRTGNLDYEEFRKEWYWRSLGVDTDSEDAQSVKNRILSLLDSTEEKLIERVAVESTREYLLGLVFVLEYYANGVKGVNPLWSYSYYYPPLLSDVIELGEEITLSEEMTGSLAKSEVNPLRNIIYQQLLIIPPQSSSLLSVDVQKGMRSEELSHLFPLSWRSAQDYRVLSFEGVSFLPMVDPQRVMRVVDTQIVPFMTAKEAAKYTPGEILELTGKPKAEGVRKTVGRYAGQKPPPKGFVATKRTTFGDNRFNPKEGRGGRGRGAAHTGSRGGTTGSRGAAHTGSRGGTTGSRGAAHTGSRGGTTGSRGAAHTGSRGGTTGSRGAAHTGSRGGTTGSRGAAHTGSRGGFRGKSSRGGSFGKRGRGQGARGESNRGK